MPEVAGRVIDEDERVGAHEFGPSGPRVNLGCGPVMRDGWINVDGSRRAWLLTRATALDRLLVRLGLIPPTAFKPSVLYHNLLKPLPWPNGSIAAIYAGEVWEHLRPADGERLTRECYRVLAQGGVLRLCVPDGVEFWRRYLQIFAEECLAPRPHRRPERLRRHVQMYFDDICTSREFIRSFGHFHKWQYDEIQITDLLERSGFTDVERKPFRVSRIAGIDVVERSDFLIVEGVKAWVTP